MSDEKHDKDIPVHNVFYNESGTSIVPMQMQLLSTWEVRKVPANCVSRLCTLTVTHLEVIHPLDTGHGSIVLSTSMKTPHRFLRSNEIRLPSNGILNIPLQLTFSLQYPHFLKRGGNVLQIRLQRRKRVRNRPLGGYKTLAIGKVEMSQVLQHSFQGEVKLYAEKVTDHVAVVTVGSLTSTLVDMERRSHMAEVSSDEDEDDIFSDDLVERGSDSESGDNEPPTSHDRKAKRFKNSLFQPPSTAAVLRLLRLNRPSKGRHTAEELLGEEEAEEYRASSVAFVSSPSESEEEEYEIGASPPKPTLSPFFGSDRCSMVSLPTSAKSAETMTKHQAALSHRNTREYSPQTNLKRYSSLEEAIETERILTSIEIQKEWNLSKGCVWCVADGLPASQVVVSGLERDGEVTTTVNGEKEAVHELTSLLGCVQRQWKEKHPLSIVLVGNDNLVSSAAQALVSSKCAPEQLRFAIIPTAPGLMSARLANIDEQYQSTFPMAGNWTSVLKDTVDPLLEYVQDAGHSLPLHLAQAVLHTPTGESGGSSFREQYLPFMCSVSVGGLEEPDNASASGLPLSPTSSSSTATGEPQELVLEYWSPKGQKTHHDSVKVRSVIISCAHQVLNVTATKDKKGKSIRKRKPKEDAGGSIVSLTATQLVCRSVNKGECLTAVVDGVEHEGVSLVKLSALWEKTQIRTFNIAITSALEER